MAIIDLAGNDKAAWEKLDAALAHAYEAADRMLYMSCVAALKHGVEAATELGMHLQDERYSKVAMAMEASRKALATMTHAAFCLRSPAIAAQLQQMWDRVTILRMQRTGTLH